MQRYSELLNLIDILFLFSFPVDLNLNVQNDAIKKFHCLKGNFLFVLQVPSVIYTASPKRILYVDSKLRN